MTKAQKESSETTTKNADGSNTVSRTSVSYQSCDGSPCNRSESTGTITLKTQNSANGAPAVVDSTIKTALLNFSAKEGVTVNVNSGTRTSEQNAAVGGASSSQHLVGNAADIAIEGRTPEQTGAAAADSNSFATVNVYTDGRGVHVDMKARSSNFYRQWQPATPKR